jgi:hypothetical protein
MQEVFWRVVEEGSPAASADPLREGMQLFLVDVVGCFLIGCRDEPNAEPQ